METGTTMAAAALALPDDSLAVVLGRLPARNLAASRGVCKAWRDLIDDRQLLVQYRHLFPHSVRGLFINYKSRPRPHFFSRPTPATCPDGGIDGRFDFIERQGGHDGGGHQVVDHCNGLVLILESQVEVLHVCNPATRWSARLPPCPGGGAWPASSWGLGRGRRAFLVFDPFASPEFKVLLAPLDLDTTARELYDDEGRQLVEWPPSPWTSWHEFSSVTGRWEEKLFVREGEAAGTAWHILANERRQYAAYWQGALYVHCRGEYVSRFSLLDGKYRIIKPPIQLAERKNSVRSFLGKSEKGVYIAAIAVDSLPKLRVWTLSESNNQILWAPKHPSNLKINTYSWRTAKREIDRMKYLIRNHEPKYWILDLSHDGRKNEEVSLEQDVCWNSDDDNIFNSSDDEKEGREDIKFLGFHPYKEVIFLCCDGHAVALHLNSPKVQYLGTVHHGGFYNYDVVRGSFVYTPCLFGN